jgi:hypothetical protein
MQRARRPCTQILAGQTAPETAAWRKRPDDELLASLPRMQAAVRPGSRTAVAVTGQAAKTGVRSQLSWQVLLFPPAGMPD